MTEFGGSELQKLVDGAISGQAPTIDLDIEARRQHQLLTAIRSGLVASAHDVSEGGMSVALAEVVFGTELGLDVTLEGSAVTALFSESQSRFVVTVSPEHAEDFEAAMPEAKRAGVITASPSYTVKSTTGEVWIDQPVAELFAAWKGAIPCLLNSED